MGAAAENWEELEGHFGELAVEDATEDVATNGLPEEGHAEGAEEAGPQDGLAGAGSAKPGPIEEEAALLVDHALRDALCHPKNRNSVLRLEAEVEAFVSSGEEGPYVFSGDMSTYERLLAHRTAQHWGLLTTTPNQGPHEGRIVASRSDATTPPRVRLSDVAVTMAARWAAPAARG